MFLVLHGRIDAPVFARNERSDFVLSLDDQPQSGALHAPGRQSTTDFLPQQRGQIEPDEVIQRASRLLSVHERFGQLTWMIDGILNGALRDFVKHDPMDVLAVQQVSIAQYLVDVP